MLGHKLCGVRDELEKIINVIHCNKNDIIYALNTISGIIIRSVAVSKFATNIYFSLF